MCFVHAFLPSDFFVHLSGCCICRGAAGLQWLRPLPKPDRGLLHLLPRGSRAFGVLAADVTTVAATSASTEAARVASLPSRCRRISLAIPVYTGPPGHVQVAAHARSPSPRDEDEPEVAKTAASRCRSRSPAVRVTAEPGGSGRRTSYSRTSGAILTLRVADRRSTDRSRRQKTVGSI